MKKMSTLTKVVGSLSLGALVLGGCSKGETQEDPAPAAEGEAEAEGGGEKAEGEGGSCGGEGGSCGGEGGSCGGGK